MAAGTQKGEGISCAKKYIYWVRCFAACNTEALLYMTLSIPLGLKYSLVCSLLKQFIKEDVSLVNMHGVAV